MPLLLDENLEAEIIEDLRTVRDFRVSVARPGVTDRALWDQALRTGAILVTGDDDFWDDHRPPWPRALA